MTLIFDCYANIFINQATSGTRNSVFQSTLVFQSWVSKQQPVGPILPTPWFCEAQELRMFLHFFQWLNKLKEYFVTHEKYIKF